MTIKNKKAWTIAGIVVGVLVVAAAVLHFVGKSKMPQITISTTAVSRGDIHNAVTATGTIEPVTKVDVGTQVSGIVDKLYVDYNSTVKKGQLIAELDRTNLRNSLEQAKMTVASNQTEYDYQLKNYNRQKSLYEQGYVSDKEYDEALYAYEKAKNSLAIAKSQQQTAQTNLSYATIYSPIDGVVISKAVEEGQTVQAAMSTPTLYTIAADLTDMRVIADIDEADIGQVAEGMRVVYTVDAYPGVEFEGTVAQVRQEATTTSNVVTYEVVITAPNPELKLKPGMTASVSIRTMEREGVLLIPSKALRFTPTAGPRDTIIDNTGDCAHKVWTREGFRYEAHCIEIGESTGSQTEVLSGLSEGMQVITGMEEGTMGAMPTDESAQGGTSSPFMPGPPGSKKK